MEQNKVIPSFLNDALGFNIDRVANRYRIELIRALTPYDLTPEQWQIMAIIWYSPEALNQQDITQLLTKDKHNVSRMVRRLEAKGWLERRPDPHSRALFIRPTKLGERLKGEVPQALYAHFATLDLGLSQTQEQELVTLLKIVRTHLRDDEEVAENNSELEEAIA